MKYIDYNPGELKRVIIHELGHTFGFDYRLFPYLRHDDGSPRTMRNQHTGEPELPTNANEGLKADRNTIKYVSRTWHTVSGENTYKRVALTLPSVVNFARNHFRCNELDAVDLESDGGDGNKHSHFERRLSIVKCSLEFKHLVYFRGDWRECPRDGGIMEIAEDITRHDWIQCPRFHDVCSVEKIRERNKRREKEQNLIAQS
ncbi:unnamed protein product [Schistosoma mattheei]|uniref:Leishmanolysin-like peptidase n=1 Tax=Schistosoma mattheei TaxID=31246 RepID=A0AA85BVU9_9TREM|nr:unnamed protein product [Schistosoma mattheei]